jgi:hypothetical protein
MANAGSSGKQEKWSPELLAAAVTIILFLLAQGRSWFEFLPSATDVGIGAAVTVVAAAFLRPLLYRLSAAAQFFITLVTTIVILVGISFAAYWHQTSPGRSASSEAAGWSTVNVVAEPGGKRIHAAPGKYGTGYGWDQGRQVYIHMDSNGPNMISWLPSTSTTGAYYAQVQAKQLSGSDATACVLSFAWKNGNSFFHLALRSDGLQLAYWDGKIPARAYEGPVAVPYATNLAAWHTIAVLVQGSQVTAFVDNYQVFSDSISQSLTGGVTFGTMDIGTGYDDDATCEFQNAEIRTQR